MNKIALLLIVSLIFVGGCVKKAEVEGAKTTGETGEALTGTETVLTEESTPLQTQETKTAVMEKETQTQQPVETSQGGIFKKPSAEEIQQALKNANLYQGNIDGKLGPKTKKAIEEFQAQNNLKADGKVGPQTWQKLQPYLAKTEETSSPKAKR